MQAPRLDVRLFIGLAVALGCATTQSAALPPPPPPAQLSDVPPGQSPEGALPDPAHGRKSVITPSQVPVGETQMGTQSNTGTTGSPTVPEIGKGTVGSGAQP